VPQMQKSGRARGKTGDDRGHGTILDTQPHP
jgi:hypothetical protein